MFFLLSKIAWLVIQPIGLIVLFVAAILIASMAGWLRSVRILSFLLLTIIVTTTQTNLGRLLLQPLESRFDRPEDPTNIGQIAGIVVLGGGFNGRVTLERGGFELGEAGERFVEGLRLTRILPDAPLVVSGGEASLIGATEGDAPIAARFFAEFGVSADRIVLENRSLNTYQNAAFTKAAIAEKPAGKWLLVTSAFHMPRSVGAFRKQGVDVIPWPVDFRTSGRERFSVGRDDPLVALFEVSVALREWTGLVVYAATDRTTGVFPQ